MYWFGIQLISLMSIFSLRTLPLVSRARPSSGDRRGDEIGGSLPPPHPQFRPFRWKVWLARLLSLVLSLDLHTAHTPHVYYTLEAWP